MNLKTWNLRLQLTAKSITKTKSLLFIAVLDLYKYNGNHTNITIETMFAMRTISTHVIWRIFILCTISIKTRILPAIAFVNDCKKRNK